MGWSSGSYIAEDIWSKYKKDVDDPIKRKKFALFLYNLFSDHDADDWSNGKNDVWATAKPREYKQYMKQGDFYE
jgi:hypothetical protein